MKISMVSIFVAAVAFLFPMADASATNYDFSYSVDPTTLSCGYFDSAEICGGYQPLRSPISLNVGDQVTETINYTSPLQVPASIQGNNTIVGLFNKYLTTGPALPGPDEAAVSSTVVGLVADHPLITAYTISLLDQYAGSVGFCCGYTFSDDVFLLDSITTKLSILSSDPNPMVAADYGYQLTLPYTPAVLDDRGGAVDHPVILPAGYVGAISSDISGGTNPEAQFYDFVWHGGLFQTLGTIAQANPLANFNFQLRAVGATTALDEIGLDAANNFTGLMSYELAAGDYEIGLSTDSPYDPRFKITFETPVGGAVPEPAAWAMLLVGFGGLGAVLRSRRRHLATA